MSRLRREDGFTLPELLTTMVITMIVVLAALSLVEFVMKRTGEINDRVDATQRARTIMDTVTRELRSQVCLDDNTAAMATGTGVPTDRTDASFYADLSDDTNTTKPPADLHTISYNATTQQLIDKTYVSSWGPGSPPVAQVSATPTSTKVIANAVVPNPGQPMFTYYAFDDEDPPQPQKLLGDPTTGVLSLDDVKIVARIDLNFIVLPYHGSPTSARTAVTLQDEVYVRAANPNDDAPTPTCA